MSDIVTVAIFNEMLSRHTQQATHRCLPSQNC